MCSQTRRSSPLAQVRYALGSDHVLADVPYCPDSDHVLAFPSLLPLGSSDLTMDASNENPSRPPFGDATKEELDAFVRSAVPKNTRVATSFWINVFREFCQERRVRIEFVTCTAEELNDAFCRFYKGLRTKAGGFCKKPSYLSARGSIGRHFTVELKRPFNVFQTPAFQKSNRKKRCLSREQDTWRGVDRSPRSYWRRRCSTARRVLRRRPGSSQCSQAQPVLLVQCDNVVNVTTSSSSKDKCGSSESCAAQPFAEEHASTLVLLKRFSAKNSVFHNIVINVGVSEPLAKRVCKGDEWLQTLPKLELRKKRFFITSDLRTKTNQDQAVELRKPVLVSMNFPQGKLVFLFSLSWSHLKAHLRPREERLCKCNWLTPRRRLIAKLETGEEKKCGKGLLLAGRRRGLEPPRRHFRPPKVDIKSLNSVTVHL